MNFYGIKKVVCELEDYLRRQSGKILCSVVGVVHALLLLLHNSLGKMGMTRQCGLIGLLVFALCLFAVESYPVEITYLESAVAKGAVCLDGSPPAYHFSPGFGKGVNNWLVHFEGGAWCSTTEECRARQKQRLGSSKFMVKTLQFSGFFSNKAKSNPDFFDWNKIKVRYCDGSSFTGDVEAVDPATNLHYRGERIFVAVIEDLKQKGMSRAQNALISGCSAGGLASILHCDKFRSLLPASTNVKCFSDAGYFINAKDITGADHTKSVFSNVVKLHGSLKNLPSSCTSRLSDPTMCFFPQYVTSQIRTPLFLLNAAYDSYQIKNTLAPGVADKKGVWKSCKSSITKCSSSQLTTMHDFRVQFLSALKEGSGPSTRGYFINSCYAHCESGVQTTWLASGSPSLENTSIAKAVGDWFYNRKSFQAIDCPYPCNKSCQNRVFED